MLDKKMTSFEKITLFISILVLIVSSISVVLNDNISSLFGKVEIVSTKETIQLNKLIDSSGYIEVINIKNIGSVAAEEINILISFKDKVPKFKISSDEPIIDSNEKDNILTVTLKRLSNNANFKLILFSKSSTINDLHYIVDSGKKKILEEYKSNKIDILNLVLLLCIICSLFSIIWVYRRNSENYLINRLEKQHDDLNEKFREVIDEIKNIQIIIPEPIENSTSVKEKETKKTTSRLLDFLDKNL